MKGKGALCQGARTKEHGQICILWMNFYSHLASREKKTNRLKLIPGMPCHQYYNKDWAIISMAVGGMYMTEFSQSHG